MPFVSLKIMSRTDAGSYRIIATRLNKLSCVERVEPLPEHKRVNLTVNQHCDDRALLNALFHIGYRAEVE